MEIVADAYYWFALVLAALYIFYARWRRRNAEDALKSAKRTAKTNATATETANTRLAAERRRTAAQEGQIAELRRELADKPKSIERPDTHYAFITTGAHGKFRWVLRDGTLDEYQTLAQTARSRGFDTDDEVRGVVRAIFGDDMPIHSVAPHGKD